MRWSKTATARLVYPAASDLDRAVNTPFKVSRQRISNKINGRRKDDNTANTR